VGIVGGGGFFTCRSLMSITIPSSITSIGMGGFWGWTNEQTIRIQTHESAPEGWDSNWDKMCNAQIIWGVE